MRGRPPKPTAQLKLRGTFRSKRHAGRLDESKLADGPQRPDGLTAEAAAFWDAHVPPLVESGIAKALDAPLLQGMCEWWALYRDALSLIVDGPLIARLRAQSMASAAWKSFSDVAAQFGLSPAARAKLSIEPPKAADEFSEFLHRRKGRA